MPITKGAEKAHRGSERKKVFNIRRKSAMKDAEKAINKAVSAGQAEEAKGLLSTAYKAIDKAAKRGVIKSNTADRKKSRLSARIKNAVTKK
ncbi:30S ribosomal protein S20 [Candidatus Kaiserbacteria bacterium]|nr:30S ribosomal protein S20 [Candidatus Kaiserbacteria bacterium]